METIDHRSDDLIIQAKWSTGQRTPLWDAFWHRILADIAPDGRIEEQTDAQLPKHPERRA